MSDSEFGHLFDTIDKELSLRAEKRRCLRNLDLFVLDNSLRESTVGQIRGHTLKNKWAIFEEVKKCGFKNIIVSSFSHMPRVDDEFVKNLSERESDLSSYFNFSEIGEGERKIDLPVSLRKMQKYGLENPIFEIDLANCNDEEEKCHVKELLQARFDFTYKNLSSSAKILVNFRDFAPSMVKHPEFVFDVVKFLALMPDGERPFGIIYEEPTGHYLPEQLGAWTKGLRQLMDECSWKSGHLLVHVHKKWEMAEVAQLECLACGADGVWASVCEEGAAMGHACSIITIMNLIRMGNTRVLSKYNCTHLREAAIKVTEVTTGKPPHPKQTVYGERALDVVLDTLSTTSNMHVRGGRRDGRGRPREESTDSPFNDVREFDLAGFFGTQPPIRITTVASPAMVRKRLVDLFGPHSDFTEDIAVRMKELMVLDLDANSKQEYMSAAGLAVLYQRAGGTLTEDMILTIERVNVQSHVHQVLIREVRQIWDHWDPCPQFEEDRDPRELEEGSDSGQLEEDRAPCQLEEGREDWLSFHAFYNGFMSPYFGCYECDYSRRALGIIGMHRDNKVEWGEFCVYLKWAVSEFPDDIATADELLALTFRKGIIPVMRDEMAKKQCTL